MSNTLILLCLLAGCGSVYAADSLVSFPYSNNPCTCLLLTCTCCSGIQVSKVGFQKNVCVVLDVKLLLLQIDVTIKLDNKTLTQFSFSAKNPPTYCIPITLPISVSMCLKIHDVKLVSLTAIQVCMTLYAGYDGSNVFVRPLNCVKISAGSMTYFTTTSTSSTTSTTTARTTTTTTTTKSKAG